MRDGLRPPEKKRPGRVNVWGTNHCLVQVKSAAVIKFTPKIFPEQVKKEAPPRPLGSTWSGSPARVERLVCNSHLAWLFVFLGLNRASTQAAPFSLSGKTPPASP